MIASSVTTSELARYRDILILTALQLLAGATARAEQVNLLPNPSFESGSNLPSGWNRYAYSGTSFQRATDHAHTGTASGYIAVVPEGAEAFPQYNFTVTSVKPGEKYAARVWVRTEEVASAWGPTIGLEFFDAAGARLPWIDGEQAGGGSNDWQELSVEGYIPPTAVKMMLTLWTHGVGRVWYDDAQLVKVQEADAFTGNRVSLQVRPGKIINSRFLGFGAHGDYFLTRDFNLSKGVNDADRKLVLDRVAAMRPHIIRVLFDYKWWEPVEGRRTTDSQDLRDQVQWIGFLKSIGTDVIVHPWGDHFAYSAWMLRTGDPDWWKNPISRLPIAAKRDAMVRSLADYIRFLRRDKGLSNVRYVCLINEPDNDPSRPVDVTEYIRLNRLLKQMLKEGGVGDEVILLGPDDSSAPVHARSLWYRQTLSAERDLFGALSSHTYRHQDTRLLEPWVRSRLDLLRPSNPIQPPQPLLITEFGYGGATFENSENGKYEYGLFLADFAIAALNSGASAANTWCLFDTYYSMHTKQEWGLWRYKDEGWAPRPGFYAWSLITRHTEPGSQVPTVDVSPPADGVRVGAMLSPAGQLSILAVNRYDRAIQAKLNIRSGHESKMKIYGYTRRAIAAATGQMLEASGELTVPADLPASLELPAQSFLLLAEPPLPSRAGKG